MDHFMDHQVKTVAVSGGFDPIHIGHVRMFEQARKLGDRLVVILNNDAWLKNKKGYRFMPEEERAEIIRAFPFVDDVYLTKHLPNDPDRSVCEALKDLAPDVFANGGDRSPEGDPVPEVAICQSLGIEMVYNVGDGGKVQSSSWLTDKFPKHQERPWGDMDTFVQKPGWWLKRLTIKAGEQLSTQKHFKRSEIWVCTEGSGKAVINGESHDFELGAIAKFKEGVIHTLLAETDCTFIEIAYGPEMSEDDIERISDKYGRA